MSDTVVYFSKTFLNNLRIQCGMKPNDRDQETINAETRKEVAKQELIARRDELTSAIWNYRRAKKALKETCDQH